MCSADLNGDGWVDLIEANFYTMQVTIAFGSAQGTFATFYELDTIGHSWKVNVSDLDGDGKVDRDADPPVLNGSLDLAGHAKVSVTLDLEVPSRYSDARRIYAALDPDDEIRESNMVPGRACVRFPLLAVILAAVAIFAVADVPFRGPIGQASRYSRRG